MCYRYTHTNLAKSASCLGSLRSTPGIPPGGSFFPVMYSVKSGSTDGTDIDVVTSSSVPTKGSGSFFMSSPAS